jgi:uroporphyrin-III C-methyltransferase
VSVAIVGAGPGDPQLITVRGLELVEACDVLVYDRLVSPSLVARATAATRIPRETLTQSEVNDLLVHHGRRGRAVVRLKGGDPFVFGRGGEEVEALAAAGIEHEIVPGVSTLTAVPALAGIPLTHRGTAAQVTVLTGTSGDGADLDYARLAATPGTLVIFMGLGRLAWIADNLILNGRSFDEPAAVVSRASLPDTRVVVGTLGTIAATAADLPSPSLVIVGQVAKLAWQVRTLAQEVGRRG